MRLFYEAWQMLDVKSSVVTDEKFASAIVEMKEADNQDVEKWRMPSAKLEEWCTPAVKLFNSLNYSCLLYLSGIEDICLQLPSEDDIRKYMLENISEEEFMKLKAESER